MSNFQRRLVQSNYTTHSVQGTLTNASAALLTSGDGAVYIIDKIFLTEYAGGAHTATLRHLDSGNVDDATANIFTAMALAANETIEVEGPIILSDGASLKGLADANTCVNYLISYRKEV